ncbi:hypothetical protein BJV78DRAFT_1302727 [Lactifluus subvellereus]|nr:hypothetical protein BJV78DRAFT_1302727 [Lactifluus subvellereus]
MSDSPSDIDLNVLHSVVDHVFMPPKLPQEAPSEQDEQKTNVALCHILIYSVYEFIQYLPLTRPSVVMWIRMANMLELAQQVAKGPFAVDDLQDVLSNLSTSTEDVFAMHIRAQNAAVIVRSRADVVQFEMFEVSPQASSVMSTEGKLLCSYPGPAIEVSKENFENECFRRELASYLLKMDIDVLDSSVATTTKARSTVREVRESAHPKYICGLLASILCAYGQPTQVKRITKRIGDEVLYNDAYKPWRRSPLWLVLRVSLQTSLPSISIYKAFMLFFHARLLRICTQRHFPSELLFAMRAKMARRLSKWDPSKLDPAMSDGIHQTVYDVAKETEELLRQRWEHFQQSAISPLWSPDNLDFGADVAISLRNAYPSLAKALDSTSHCDSRKPFTPSHDFRLNNIRDFNRFAGGKLAQAVARDQRIALADFELSVERHLEAWVTASLHNSDAPDVVASCIKQYLVAAKGRYKDVEDNSIMILTVMDLWKALDILAIGQCPLMKQYSPEIPRDFLHPLLLHRSGSLQRALCIEEYLCRRHEEASNTTSIFSDGASGSSFAIQYFCTSLELQRLYDEIEEHARHERKRKREELRNVNENWESLTREASRKDHLLDWRGRHVHCPRCDLERQASNLTIRVHEWPLPLKTLEAQMVVFELTPPPAFSSWREMTWVILYDIGMPKARHTQDRPESFLDAFSGLSRWAVHRSFHRITIASTTKSFADRSHYKSVRIPADESSVLINNGLSFKLFDRTRNSWVAGRFFGSSALRHCTPPAPTSGPYTPLHFSVCGTQHTSNDVISRQADCPNELSLHEYMAFSGLRSGGLLQWLNIIREIASSSLSFRREEVHTLITQAALQLGPLSDGVREWHEDLGHLDFGMTLLRELDSHLEKIEANWLEEVTIRTIVLVISRLLAATSHPDVCKRAYILLRRARSVTYKWVGQLNSKLDPTQDEPEESRTELRRKLCALAATCFSTFDVSSEHIQNILSTDKDFAIAMHCAVIIHDNTPPSSLADNSSIFLNRQINRYHRLVHFLEPSFLQGVETNPPGYDRALSHLWAGFHRQSSSSWRILPAPNSRWISCTSNGGNEVHYNLSTGQLLVGGTPLGRLPQEITEDSTYMSVLGARILDVVPADGGVHGMEFMTRSTVFGHQILFSRKNGNVILQARQGDSQLLQLIPRSTFIGDFPRRFIDGYIHWLDLRTREVEFRPARSPWKSDPSNWRLFIHKPGSQSHSMLRKPSQSDFPIELVEKLVDIRSSTFKMVSDLLSSLESPEHMIVVLTDQALEASLPRLRLSFFVNKNSELECRSMPGYVVDKTQSFGTMFGLKNRLVLCPSSASPEESLLPRRVIIPRGDISFIRNGDFTSVSINTDTKKRVRWLEYMVDTDLGCLTSNASLDSKLYKCYLHALTSHCLPDPLLGHTGTEEALYILRSAGCRSFQRLDDNNAKLLELISDLSPNRVYYPPHLQSMVTVDWNDLPALSQHDDFHPTVCSLLDHARALEVLYDRPGVFEISDRDVLLLNRAARRNMVYYPQDLRISEEPSSTDDVQYKSRDVPTGGTTEYAAYQTSWSIRNYRPSPDSGHLRLWDKLCSWGSLGPARSDVTLRYSRYWLENFDAKRDWIAIYNLCRAAAENDPEGSETRFKLTFSLSAASYSQSEYAKVVPLILIFAADKSFRHLSPPPQTRYNLSDGLFPGFTRVRNLIRDSARRIDLTPAQLQVTQALREDEYSRTINEESSTAARSKMYQWPNYNLPLIIREEWFHKSDCEQHVLDYLQSISWNIELHKHILQLQAILQRYNYGNVVMPTGVPYVFTPHFVAGIPEATRISYAIRPLLESRANDAPQMSGHEVPSFHVPDRTVSPRPVGPNGLDRLIQEFQRSNDPLLRHYGIDLGNSHRKLKEQGDSLRDRRFRIKEDMFFRISEALAPSQSQRVGQVISIAGLWPRITPQSILRQLTRDRVQTLPDQWRQAITHYAVAFLRYQQSQRILRLSLGERHQELLREVKTSTRSDFSADSSPDWLLIQIEANMRARPIQLTVAHQMISPDSNKSISLQLNMGEGKSSVIVPLVASKLANGSNLVRVVTLKPLSNQMFSLLVSRLSGLANRPVFYIPFSRSLRMDASLVRTISNLYKRCVADGGILVIQPEHILSQKLMCIDTLLTPHGDRKEPSIAGELKDLQDWLAEVSRDVLDESDEILHVRYQLVYTIGESMPVEDHPNRWVTMQQVFSQLRTHAVQLCAKYPKVFELDQTQRGFPTMRILDRDVSQEISTRITDDALGGTLSSLPLTVLPARIRAAARRFIIQATVSDEDLGLIRKHCHGTSLWNGILLLRGLLVEGNGILGYVLKERRWRVDYGLDPVRTLLAVPYRAKDVPSLRAEFGHPDVAIALTCLSYYYNGLKKEQVLLCFELLDKIDNPEMEYDDWVESEKDDIPEALRQLNGVNTEDDTQVDESLVPLFSRNTRVVDFYLSHVVFPRAAKEFKSKLSTSAWDLVEDKANVTTGFSGTNDNQYLLPTSITQEDPVSQLSTNALVLKYLLQPENDHYECTAGDNGERESAADFLKRLVKQRPEIRVLLDVGAQMLELQNDELARHWLDLRPDVSAAVFFNDWDDLTVLTQDGVIEPFISSPFNRQLDKCVVYLDDAHTRGTDLKLPQEMRAAVTLGPKVTKDRLVQGCMRMRQLGKGQSVMFFAPGEVDRRIRSHMPSERRRVRVLDILRWAMHETCEDIRHHLPLWAQQGIDHRRRFTASKDYDKTADLDVLRSAWVQPESRTLEEMYHPHSKTQGNGLTPDVKNIPELYERMKKLGVVQMTDVRRAEEQEREVDHEVEREFQVQRPPRVRPAQHVIREDIRTFVKTGKIPSSSTRIYPLFYPTGISELDSCVEWSPSPLATEDFAITMENSNGKRLTDYLRPVNWILSSGSGKESTVIVISPYEANALLPIIRKSKEVRLHVYAPRVTVSMRSFSDLTFYSIPESPAQLWSAPPHVRTELNIFAGQLYFDSREEYERLCELLALTTAHPGAQYNEVDGFVPPRYRTGGVSPFETSKIQQLKELIGLRRKGMGYDKTHLGQVLNARPLGQRAMLDLSS